jgi:Holliday junction resolvase RusA-like endonuclease
MMHTSEAIAKAIGSPDYVLEVRMPLFSKARPRLTKTGHAYMPQAYRDAQAEMQRQIREQWPHEPLEGPIALYIRVYGEGRGDSDNISGAILDAAGPSKGKPGILWEDDRVSVIPCLIFEWEKASKPESRWVIQIAVL